MHVPEELEKNIYIVYRLYFYFIDDLMFYFSFSQASLNSIKSITQNLSDMNKFLDDISEYKVVDRLKEKLQESENLKLEIEAVLIKRVNLFDDRSKRV